MAVVWKWTDYYDAIRLCSIDTKTKTLRYGMAWTWLGGKDPYKWTFDTPEEAIKGYCKKFTKERNKYARAINFFINIQSYANTKEEESLIKRHIKEYTESIERVQKKIDKLKALDPSKIDLAKKDFDVLVSW